MPEFLSEILLRRGTVPAEQLTDAAATAERDRITLAQVLVNRRLLDEKQLLTAIAEELGMPVVEHIKTEEVPAELINAIPIAFARHHRLLPMYERDGVVHVATAHPLELSALDDLRVLLGKPTLPVAALEDTIVDAINRVYERKDETALAEAKDGKEEEELQDLIDMTDEAPVIRWVNNLFYHAVRDRVSDIHIEPSDHEVVVRYRIDGELYPVRTAHKGFLPSIVSRVKIEAGLNIAEKRLPQDGRITKKIAGKLVDVRVSTIPTSRGERIVMRLLDKEQVLLDLPELGFDREQLSLMESLIERPDGIILVTGPTGSGKTTTLYACLNKLNKPGINILTVEDPVEYELRGIGQMQIQPRIGLSFASGLRSFLRQDPDVIMVGEIRDHETAEIAIHASLTGHLVLSTLHTNDASGAVTRLAEMGVQPFHISSTLVAVLAQRLVRRLCLECRQLYHPGSEEVRALGINPDLVPTQTNPSIKLGDSEDPASMASRSLSSDATFYRPVGCEKCAGTGYRGRLGIYELLVVDEAIRREINSSSDSKTLHRVAVQRGMRSLREDGGRQVLAGWTSIEEVLAATQAGELEQP
ncbi:MAG: type II secretion system ATPase GspE [Myxococcales bacterium]|nr:type II secretion system ATPase GspE [Myxococcales bacterium]MCB9709273.1 type II secretion system ATPase GspE [Myxococcales bacterium]